MKLRGSDPERVTHRCERRASKRLLCSDLVQLQWIDADGSRHQEIAILENLSRSGVGLFAGVPILEGTEVQLAANRIQLIGHVRQCVFRENGYIVGLEFDLKSKSTQQPGRTFLPAHLLDVSMLDLG